MGKKVYYIECNAIKDFKFNCGWCGRKENVFHLNDILYFNNVMKTNEMHVPAKENIYKDIIFSCFLPFTTRKSNAKIFNNKKSAEFIANKIKSKGQFNAIVKEIKIF